MPKFPIIVKTFSPNIKLVSGKVLICKSKKSLEQGGEYDALLTDLSKTFSCLPHDLVIEKLHACGFWHSTIKTYA